MSLPIEIQVALIAAITSTIITPLVQLGVAWLKRKHDYQHKIAPVVEHIRVLRRELLQEPLNPNMQGIIDRITIVENFHDPIFNCLQKHNIKLEFLKHAKRLEARHKQTRPWMQIEYPEECKIFGNLTERLLAVLNKEKNIPELFDPSE